MRVLSIVLLVLSLTCGCLSATFLQSLAAWNTARAACKTTACRTAADNTFKPAVKSAVNNGEVSVIDSCVSGWGNYEYMAADGSYVEARLPC